jgi:hypothetical protein
LVAYESERVMCDEGHVLRNPKTLVSEGVRQVKKANVHFLTATPILNHSPDLRGFLSLIWKLRLYNVLPGFMECYNEDFNQARVIRSPVPAPPIRRRQHHALSDLVYFDREEEHDD